MGPMGGVRPGSPGGSAQAAFVVSYVIGLARQPETLGFPMGKRYAGP